MKSNGKVGAFLDRDGTVIEDVPYVSDADKVTLIPGSARAIKKLNQAGIKVIIVTNQSGIARGLITEQELHAVNRRMEELLGKEGAHIDTLYYCPHLPHELLSPGMEPCDCRKPDLGMVTRAENDMGIDPGCSCFIGDRWSDVELGLRTGGQAYLVRTGYGEKTAETLEAREGIHIVKDLLAGVTDFLTRIEEKS